MRLAACLLLLLPVTALAAPPTADADAAIQKTVARYASAWAEGNGPLLQSILTPQFTQDVLVRAPHKPDSVRLLTGLQLVDLTQRGNGRFTPVEERAAKVRVFDVSDGVASARMTQGPRSELLQLMLVEGQWRISHSATFAKE